MSDIELRWENVEEILDLDDGEAYGELCDNSKPSDFYFAVNDSFAGDDDSISICLVPKAYFDSEGCMWDQEMSLNHILPNDFHTSMESVWECDRSKDDVRADLIARGFQENEKFNHMAGNSY